MPLTLNLGCVDIPYATPAPADGKEAKPNSATTGDVAGWLENRYHVMEHFYQFDADKIAEHVAESLAGALESAAMGAPTDGLQPFAAAEEAIGADFRAFLTLRTIESLGYPGIPTLAALEGVSHRFKNKRGPRRPSFVDTGLYQSAFRSWFDHT